MRVIVLGMALMLQSSKQVGEIILEESGVFVSQGLTS